MPTCEVCGCGVLSVALQVKCQDCGGVMHLECALYSNLRVGEDEPPRYLCPECNLALGKDMQLVATLYARAQRRKVERRSEGSQ